MGVGAWNPWAALRDRAHLLFGFDPAAEHLGGAFYARRGPVAVIVVDPRLGRRHRNAALAHELVHDERGPIPEGTPPALAGKEEAAVERIVAERLVPPDALAAFVERRITVGPVTIADIAAEFDVPEYIVARVLAERGARCGMNDLKTCG